MKDKVFRVAVVLSRSKDGSMINHLKRQPSMSGYIKRLIREDMAPEDKTEDQMEDPQRAERKQEHDNERKDSE